MQALSIERRFSQAQLQINPELPPRGRVSLGVRESRLFCPCRAECSEATTQLRATDPKHPQPVRGICAAEKESRIDTLRGELQDWPHQNFFY